MSSKKLILEEGVLEKKKKKVKWYEKWSSGY